MDSKAILVSRYGAGLKMLKETISKSSKETWYSKNINTGSSTIAITYFD